MYILYTCTCTLKDTHHVIYMHVELYYYIYILTHAILKKPMQTAHLKQYTTTMRTKLDGFTHPLMIYCNLNAHLLKFQKNSYTVARSDINKSMGRQHASD